MMLAVDPGIRGCGVALFEARELRAAAYVPNMARSGNGPRECWLMASSINVWVAHTIANERLDRLVLEWPQVYAPGKGKGDPNDLFALAGIGAALCAELKPFEIEHYLPRAWKGQMPKEVVHQRMLTELSQDEFAKIRSAGRLTHNVWDAVSLGLFSLDRLTPKRVIAR